MRKKLNLESIKIISKNIRKYLDLHEIKPEDLASKCGTSKQQLYLIIKGATRPKIDFLDRLSKGMEISSADLLTKGFFDNFTLEKKIVKKN